MKKIFLLVTLFASLTAFAHRGPGSRDDVKDVSTVAIGAEAINVGMILDTARAMIIQGYTGSEVKSWMGVNIQRAFLLRKISLVGLAYAVGDYTGTKIYENLPEDKQEALGEIIDIMIENTKADLGIKSNN